MTSKTTDSFDELRKTFKIDVRLSEDDLGLLLAIITVRKSQLKNYPYDQVESPEDMRSLNEETIKDLEKLETILSYEYERVCNEIISKNR